MNGQTEGSGHSHLAASPLRPTPSSNLNETSRSYNRRHPTSFEVASHQDTVSGDRNCSHPYNLRNVLLAQLSASGYDSRAFSHLVSHPHRQSAGPPLSRAEFVALEDALMVQRQQKLDQMHMHRQMLGGSAFHGQNLQYYNYPAPSISSCSHHANSPLAEESLTVLAMKAEAAKLAAAAAERDYELAAEELRRRTCGRIPIADNCCPVDNQGMAVDDESKRKFFSSATAMPVMIKSMQDRRKDLEAAEAFLSLRDRAVQNPAFSSKSSCIEPVNDCRKKAAVKTDAAKTMPVKVLLKRAKVKDVHEKFSDRKVQALKASPASVLKSVEEDDEEGAENEDAFGKNRKKRKKRDDPNAPRRPLSAYNFFFSEEREFILEEIPVPIEGEEAVKPSPISDSSGRAPPNETLAGAHRRIIETRRMQMTTRRPHRKTHGKIGFKVLAKLIGERWRNLPAERVRYYQGLASLDLQRYKADVATYLERKKIEEGEGLSWVH